MSERLITGKLYVLMNVEMFTIPVTNSERLLA